MLTFHAADIPLPYNQGYGIKINDLIDQDNGYLTLIDAESEQDKQNIAIFNNKHVNY